MIRFQPITALRRRTFEGFRGGADDLGAIALDLEHREAALNHAVGAEAEDAVDAGKSARIVQRRRRIGVAAGLAGRDGRQGRRVVAEGGKTRRRQVVERAEPLPEVAGRGGCGRGDPAADQRRLGAEAGLVPQAGPEAPHLGGVDVEIGQQRGDGLELAAAVGQQHGVETGIARRLARRQALQGLARRLVAGGLELRTFAPERGLALVEAGEAADDGAKIGRAGLVELGLHQAGAHRRRRVAQLADDKLAIGRVRRQRREARRPPLMGKGGDAIDGLARRKTEQERAVAGELAGRREGDYVDVGLARHRLDPLHLGGQQRPQNHLRPPRKRPAGGPGCPLPPPLGVAGDEGGMPPGDSAVASKSGAADAPPSAVSPESGTIAAGLHIVATPIGNAADITLRALDVLRGVDLIACEDTRVTGNLMARYGIGTRRLAYNDHNADRMRPRLLERLRGNQRVALVSGAGTPLISDPGYKLVRAAIAEGLPVTIVPGASATLAALALSGLPSDRFLFPGFFPNRSAARRRDLAGLAGVPATLIVFESARRLDAALPHMAAGPGGRPPPRPRGPAKRLREGRPGPAPR